MRPALPAARRQLALLVLGLSVACAAAPWANTHVPAAEPRAAGEVSDPGRPQLTLRPSRPLGISPLQVTLYAELAGREDERFYCPEILWTWPDGTEASTEGDCAPWPDHTADDYQRRWSRRLLLPQGEFLFVVTLRKAGKAIAVATTRVEVR